MGVAMVCGLGSRVVQYKDSGDFEANVKSLFAGTTIAAFVTMGICSLFAASIMLGTFELTKCCILWEMTGVEETSTEPTSLIGYGKAGQMMVAVCSVSIITSVCFMSVGASNN